MKTEFTKWFWIIFCCPIKRVDSFGCDEEDGAVLYKWDANLIHTSSAKKVVIEDRLKFSEKLVIFVIHDFILLSGDIHCLELLRKKLTLLTDLMAFLTL